MPGIVTLSTCEYTSADTSIVVYRADGDVPVLNNSAACMGVGRWAAGPGTRSGGG